MTMHEIGRNHVEVAIHTPPQLKIWRGHAPKDDEPLLVKYDAS